MSSGAIVFIVFIAVVIVLLLADYFFRQRHEKPDRECTADRAWEHYVENPWSERDSRAVASLRRQAQGEARLRASLEESVTRALSAQKPLAVLREAIMDATDQFVLAETLRGSQESTSEESGDPENLALAGALRCFAMLRFGDWAKEDWYTHYVRVARMNCANVAEMVGKTVRGEQSSLETSLHDPLTRTMSQARRALLDYPPRTSVKRDTKLTSEESAVELAPSQGQIEQLTDIMTERFEKLFAGQIYRVEGGPLVNPVGAFQVDAALLHTLLALRFRQPDEGWRRIVGKSLGGLGDAEAHEQKMLETAREFRRIWIDRRQDGPLVAVLRAAGPMAFTLSQNSGKAEPESLASNMMSDASVFVGAVKHVLDKVR